MPNLRWDCEQDGCYKQLCLPDWSVLNDALAPCKLTDIDGMCERRGKFLVVEWKRPGGSVERAQELALSRLNKLDDFTVAIVHGLINPMEPKAYREPGGKDKPTSLGDFQDFVADWKRRADQGK